MCDQEVVRGHLRGHEVRLVRDLDAIVGEAIRLNLADEVDGFDAMPADERVAAYIAEHSEITNVLVSGGDAFMNSNDVIGRYLGLIGAIDHVRCIRFGTRTPVTLPQRITTDPELVELLREHSGRKRLFVVTQFNHPAEITPESAAAVQLLLHAGAGSQSDRPASRH